MDTLFRLVSLEQSSSDHPPQQQPQYHHHQSSFNSSTTSISSSHHHHPLFSFHHSSSREEEGGGGGEEDEECNNQQQQYLYMDEDHFSSSSNSSSKLPHHHLLRNIPPNNNPISTTTTTTPPNINSSLQLHFDGPHWAADLLTECARAVHARETDKIQQLMWTLNELSSPYGDPDQKIASYFLQALFARLTSSGPRTLRTLSSASDRSASFDSTRRVALRFQDLSPWSSFGHVASNGAILDSFLLSTPGPTSTGPTRLHVLDLSNTFCTQWPTLLEALATRSTDSDTPHLSITTVVPSSSSSSSTRSGAIMKELSARIEKFARLMGVPFSFRVLHGDLSSLDLSQFDFRNSPDSALAVNCVNALHSLPPSHGPRHSLLASLRRLRPRIITLVEEEADLSAHHDDDHFLRGFGECLRYFSAYFDMLEDSFPKTSNERLALERAAGRAVVDLVACPASESAERRDTSAGWASRMRAAGFVPAPFSDDVADDVRALLRRYREGWAMQAAADAGVHLTWKEQPVVWASAWKLS